MFKVTPVLVCRVTNATTFFYKISRHSLQTSTRIKDKRAPVGVVADDVQQTISTTTTKLNDLDLGLDHY